MEAPIYNIQGKSAGVVNLDDKVFGLPWNADLVHQVVVSMQSSARESIADTKDRGEVRGGGKKPWRQKGTGRARHGSRRSPIWIGGGVTHGPLSERNYAKKINRKMKTKALYTILSAKLRDHEIVFVEDLNLPAPKTKVAQESLNNLAGIPGLEKINYKRGKRALVTVPQVSDAVVKSFRNIPSASVRGITDLNPLDLVTYKYIVIANPELSLAAIAKRK